MMRRLKRSIEILTTRKCVAAHAMQFPPFAKGHDSIQWNIDYFRYATIGCMLEQLARDEIPGGFAEVGVYRGDLSAFIHNLYPQRIYYLFDTFEGFPERSLEKFQLTDKRFKDTAVEFVRGRLGESPKLVFRVGCVPDTLVGLEKESFALVILDLDLYAPTKSSLEFFYSRLSPGGFLMVHDYNNSESNWACKRAVDEFCRDTPELPVAIGDEWGSVIIRKNRKTR